MRARGRPKLHKPAGKLSPAKLVNGRHQSASAPQVIDIDEEDVQLNFGDDVLADEWHDRDGDVAVTSSSSDDEAEGDDAVHTEPADDKEVKQQPLLASVSNSTQQDSSSPTAADEQGVSIGQTSHVDEASSSKDDSESVDATVDEVPAISDAEVSEEPLDMADIDETALLGVEDDGADDEDEWPDESKCDDVPSSMPEQSASASAALQHVDSTSDSADSSEDNPSSSSSSSDEEEEEESKQTHNGNGLNTTVAPSRGMSSESEDDSIEKSLNTGKRQASTPAQPSKANKRRNTVDESSLSASQTSYLSQQQQSADQKKHASNQKLRPADRLKGADQRSMGGDASNQLKATSAAAQWFKQPSADATATRRGREYTVSVALPGSIIANCQTPELKTYVAGQIARSLAIYNVDEVIVYNEDTKHSNYANDDQPPTLDGELTTSRQRSADPNVFLARILQYLECPQYLRKALFPVHPDLKYAGLLNPLDAPHHLRIDEKAMYREGLTVERSSRGKLAPKGYTHVNIGFRQTYLVKGDIKPNVRVTVKLEDERSATHNKHEPTGTVVSPNEPRTKHGLYYGYNTRLATNLTNVFKQCPYKDLAYDCTIGTSERGIDISDPAHNFAVPATAKHILIVFGGVLGLEEYVANDESLVNINDPRELFDWYVNICPQQGSRTIRTEEAIPITMATLQRHLPQ